MTTWALIPCSKTKADHPCDAREMYWPSALFRGAWRTAEARGERPLLLSAKHGLLLPETVIEPYDATLLGQSDGQRARWACGALARILAKVRPGDAFVSYLGSAYSEYLVAWLRQAGYEVREPLKGLGQGHRLQWFKNALASGVRSA